MTEPSNEPEPAPESPEPGPAAPPEPAPSAPPASPPPVSGWVAPDGGGSGSGRRRGCIIAVVIAAAILVVGYLGLVFLGNQVLSILGGTIQFGTGGSGCSVSGTATSFPSSATIRSVAYLERKTAPGEVITIIVTYPDTAPEATEETLADAAECVTQEIAPGLDPGHYGLEYRAGTEVLATGGFDITP